MHSSVCTRRKQAVARGMVGVSNDAKVEFRRATHVRRPLRFEDLSCCAWAEKEDRESDHMSVFGS